MKRGRSTTVDHFDKELQELVARGKSQGYLTYDEVNDYLPDEEVNPEKLDNLLIALEEEGIDLVSEPPEPGVLRRGGAVGRRGRRRGRERASAAAAVPGGSSRRCRPSDGQVEQRPDPHVSQPDGRDPAADPRGGNLAGQEDRGHAEALPPHRDRLCDWRCGRRSPRCTKVHKGALPFDRTIKVSLTERLTKEQIHRPDAAQPADARAT